MKKHIRREDEVGAIEPKVVSDVLPTSQSKGLTGPPIAPPGVSSVAGMLTSMTFPYGRT